MHKMTEQNLVNAFAGESQAHMRYLHFADVAKKEGFPNIERLFRAISYAEYVHAGDHYRELRHLSGGYVSDSMGTFGPGSTNKNLGLAIAGEDFEITEMYPAYVGVASLQREGGAKRSFEWALGTERMHRALFEKAKASAEADQDAQLGPIYVCQVCGYTGEGAIPEQCPLCNVGKDKFTTFK